MSDKQALYRAKKAALASTKLSKEDIRRLKAQKAKELQDLGPPPAKAKKVTFASSPAPAPSTAGPSNGSAALAQGLIASYDSDDAEPTPPAAQLATAPAPGAAASAAELAPRVAAGNAGVSGQAAGQRIRDATLPGAANALPEDFFQNAAAATASLGAAAPKPPDLDEELAKFNASVKPDLAALQEQEEEEEREAAEEAAEREALDQQLRMERLEALKRAAKERAAADVTVAPELREVALQGAAGRRAKLLEGLLGDDHDDDDDDEESEDEKLDWRAKRL